MKTTKVIDNAHPNKTAMQTTIQWTRKILFATSARAVLVVAAAVPFQGRQAAADTVGFSLTDRGTYDNSFGDVWSLRKGSFDGLATPQLAATWGFYSTGGGASITPFILKVDSSNGHYTISGIGATRENAKTGEQTFDFGLVSGSAEIGAGYTFGWADGTTTVGNPGVVSLVGDSGGPAGGLSLFSVNNGNPDITLARDLGPAWIDPFARSMSIQVTTVPRPAQLLSHWALDETSGTMAADSAGSYNAPIGTAVVLNQVGRIGTAFNFVNDGTSYVSVGTIPWTPTQTLSAWVNSTDTTGTGDNIFGWSGNAYIQFRLVSGKLNFRAALGGFNADITSSASIADGQWHHVVAVLTGGALQLYVDGTADGAGDASGTWSTGTGWIGGLPAFPGSYQFVGQIDDVARWDGALSVGKVQTLSRVLTVNAGALNDYDAAMMDTLFQVHESGISQPVTSKAGTLNWIKFTGGSGTTGTFTYSDGVYTAWFDDTSGVTTGTPPPLVAATSVETAADGTGSPVGAQDITAGNSITVYAVARDASGNFMGNPAAAWSMPSMTGGMVSGDLVAGGASAVFTGHRVGTTTLQAVVGGLTGTSGTLTVIAGTATKLAFTTQPGGGTAGKAWEAQPVVTVQDANGNTNTTDTSTVTVEIAYNAGPGGVLSGTLTQAAEAGVANFNANALQIDKVGTGYTLLATNGTLTSATSAVFNITPRLSHWALDEISGTMATDSAGNYNAPIGTAVVLNQVGRIGTAFNFVNDGASYVSVGTIPWTPTQTLSAWVNSTDTTGTGDNIFGWSGNAYIQFRLVSGKLNFRAALGGFNADITSSASIADGQWHHVVAVLTGGALQLYVDGTADGAGDASGTWSTGTGWIGGLPAFPGSYQFVGQIDDVARWDGALSVGKVQTLSRVLTVNSGALNDYNAATMDTLFQVYESSNSQAVTSSAGTLTWTKFTGRSGTAGTVTYSEGVYTGWFDDTSGVTTAAPSLYATWATAQTPPLGDASVVGPDGLSNLLIYALAGLNTDHTNGSPGTLTGNVLSFTKRADAIANGDVTYVIEESDDLGVTNAWVPVVTQTPPNASPTISYALPIGKPKVFARLKITIQ